MVRYGTAGASAFIQGGLDSFSKYGRRQRKNTVRKDLDKDLSGKRYEKTFIYDVYCIKSCRLQQRKNCGVK